MIFYQELQLSSAGSKQLRIFCAAVVTVFSKLLGIITVLSELQCFLVVLVLRQADFGIKTSHGLISIMGNICNIDSRDRGFPIWYRQLLHL